MLIGINMKHYPQSRPSKQNGAILLEALIAVLLFSLGVLALAGLQTAMIKNTDDAKYRAEATFIAQQKFGEIWANTRNFASLADYEVTDEAVAEMPNGKQTVSVSADRVVTVTINWALPGAVEHTYSANARIEGLE
jgi:type IV pilus assembly protein PilV